METKVADRIKKRVTLRAPQSRVWRALTVAEEFGSWFGVKLEGGFAEGEMLKGNITIPGYEHLVMEVLVDMIKPETYFSYKWHPFAIDPAVDYSSEPMTLVEFHLEESEEGTLLTITESGFDQIPSERRTEAFRMNDGGWAAQAESIQNYVSES